MGQVLSIGFGSFRIQPGEFSKICHGASALCLKFMGGLTFDLSKRNYQLQAFGVFCIPVAPLISSSARYWVLQWSILPWLLMFYPGRSPANIIFILRLGF